MTTGPDDSHRSLGPTGGPAEYASSTRAPGRTAAGQRGLLSGLGDRCGQWPPFRTVRFYGRCVRYLPGRRVLVTGLMLILVALLGCVLMVPGAARAAAAATTRPHAATTAASFFPAAVTAPASQASSGRCARRAGPAAVFAPEAGGTTARAFASADPHVADAANAIEGAMPGRVVGVNQMVPMANGLSREAAAAWASAAQQGVPVARNLDELIMIIRELG